MPKTLIKEEFTRMFPAIVREIGEHLSALVGPGQLRPEAPDAIPAGYIQAVVGFRGPLRGRLTLIAPDSLCVELASNILGLPPHDQRTQAIAIDAFKTLATAACARTVEVLAGADRLCELILPTASPVPAESLDAFGRCGDALIFNVKEYTMQMLLELESLVDADPIAHR